MVCHQLKNSAFKGCFPLFAVKVSGVTRVLIQIQASPISLDLWEVMWGMRLVATSQF